MHTLIKSEPIGTLGLSSGDHLVRFHVEGDAISYEVTASVPRKNDAAEARKPTGFVQRWGGSVKKTEDKGDAWLTHINEKHLR